MATYWANDEPAPFEVWVGDTDITPRVRRLTERTSGTHPLTGGDRHTWWEIELASKDGSVTTWRTVGTITRINRDVDVNPTRPRYIIEQLDGPISWSFGYLLYEPDGHPMSPHGDSQ